MAAARAREPARSSPRDGGTVAAARRGAPEGAAGRSPSARAAKLARRQTSFAHVAARAPRPTANIGAIAIGEPDECDGEHPSSCAARCTAMPSPEDASCADCTMGEATACECAPDGVSAARVNTIRMAYNRTDPNGAWSTCVEPWTSPAAPHASTRFERFSSAGYDERTRNERKTTCWTRVS